MRVSLAVCFAAIFWGAVAHADSPAVTVQGVGVHSDTYVVGIGQSSCSSFIAAIGNTRPGMMKKMDTPDGAFVGENAEYQEWLLGFVSGFNEAQYGDKQKQIVANVDMAAIDQWMRNWCNQNPTRTVFEGASTLIDEMRSNAAPAQPPSK